ALALTAPGVCASLSAEASPVSWNFYETVITHCNASCTLPAQPYILASLTLPSETSSGSAQYQFLSSTHTNSGDDFLFRLTGWAAAALRATQTQPGPEITPFGAGPGTINDFNISWDTTDGVLNSISIVFNTFTDSVRIGMTTAELATDYLVGGCSLTQCSVSG